MGLYVGHSAYAQVLVLAVYLGGMAIGALIVADLSKRVARPWAWYVGAEVALAALGLLFHPAFVLTTGLSYDVVFPALGSASLVGGARWGIAGLLVLPQAVVLGATFPFMAAGLVRRDAGQPGQSVALAYLLNTMGGAGGVLLAGFWLIGAVGLPGTVVTAAALNGLAAALAWSALSSGGRAGVGEPTPVPEIPAGAGSPAAVRLASTAPTGLAGVLLVTAFGTAIASFAYEIAWIRMLSLVLGSATHSFELMLSAFILGLALGAWAIRRRVDRAPNPVRLLGKIQVAMGLAALASLPLYLTTFWVMPSLVIDLPGGPGAYAWFNLSKYGLCLVVMLPATVLAGMTLPVITGTLLHSGYGERSIGRVYGINTIGSVVGAALAGLLALPLLGLKGLVVAGAALDIALGVWLLDRAAAWAGTSRRPAGVLALGAGAATVAVMLGVVLDPALLTSGVFRDGRIPESGDRELLFYRHGRTATVSVQVYASDPVVTISTNGKPDASLGPRWFAEGVDTAPPVPIAAHRDYTTHVLAPLVGLAHAPHARDIAVIGHGSGMSAVAFLTSRQVERLVTIEIEPQMVRGSMVMLPVNEAVFNDPRSSFVFDDAKSYFAYDRRSFDIVFAEPSSPWVSGTASLFTTEFYERLRPTIRPRGVLVQWIHLYELNDDLFLTILAALRQTFPHYRAYLVGDMDVAVVASVGPLAEADWSVLGTDGVRDMMHGTPEFTAGHLQALFLFDDRTFELVLRQGIEANSDFRPTLDLGAERARFEKTLAEGVYSFAIDRIDIQSAWNEEIRGPSTYDLVPARGLRPLVDWGRGAWVREAVEAGGGIAPIQFPEWTDELVGVRNFYLQLQDTDRLLEPDSPAWTSLFLRVESALHMGTSGWVDSTFYGTLIDFLDREQARPEVRAAVDLLYGVNTFDWERTAKAADLLVPRVGAGENWVTPTLLLDAAVIAYAKTGRPEDARTAMSVLKPRTRRASWNLRDRLLEAMVGQGVGW